jgi:hypothetical protein
MQNEDTKSLGASELDPRSTESRNGIVGREDLSTTPGIRVTKLRLSAEARESLNAHVPSLGQVRQG